MWKYLKVRIIAKERDFITQGMPVRKGIQGYNKTSNLDDGLVRDRDRDS